MTQITTQFTQTVSKELNEALDKKRTSADAKKILEAVQRLKGKIRPLHPGIDDSTLASYFIVEIAKGADSKEAIAALNTLPGITAAYVKPKEELA
jgi:hypothetical protein